MLIRVLGKQTASPNHKTEQRYTTKAELFRTSQGILIAALLLVLAFSGGCGGGSTPLYYTAKSGISPQPLPPCKWYSRRDRRSRQRRCNPSHSRKCRPSPNLNHHRKWPRRRKHVLLIIRMHDSHNP